MEPQRRMVIRELPDQQGVRLTDIAPDGLRAAATQVAYYLDALGLLVRHKLVNPKPIYSIVGKPTVRTWEKLAPYIEAERAGRPEERYMRGFENLAEGARTFNYERDLSKLKRFGGHT